MTSHHYDEDLLSSIASLFHPPSLKPGTLKFPAQALAPILVTSNLTPEPTLYQIQLCSSTHTPNVSTVYTQPLPSALQNPRSLTSPPTRLQLIIDNCFYTIT